MMSESLIIKVKETSLPDIRLENIDWKSVDPSQQNDTQKLILVDLVDDDEDPGPQTSDLQTIDNAI